MVIELTEDKDEKGRKVGVQSHLKKDRAAHVDPWHSYSFNLLKGEEKVESLTELTIVESLEESNAVSVINYVNLVELNK